MMRYVSTRASAQGEATPIAVGLSDALNAGLAPDGGLYVPQSLPHFAPQDFAAATTLPTIAKILLQPFFAGDALESELAAICDQAFTFIAPLKSLPIAETFALELFHGPTAAFKDFGARFLAACLQRIKRDDARVLTILVATSGDTGSAVAAAFHNVPGIRVVILYPDGLVSPRQAHQLGCVGDNISALRVAGTFDDCQRLVKQAFNDTALRDKLPLSSANSISLGRLLPQMSYYAWAALSHWREHASPLNFVIPTGNLGNAMAALLARAIGLPLGEIVLATNANRTLPDFFDNGEYRARPSIATIANAMDVGDPSNYERLRWLFPDTESLQKTLRAIAVDDATIRTTIAAGEKCYGEIWCPHTAVAMQVLEQLRAENTHGDWAIVATAHPAKFDTVVEPLIDHGVAVPPALAALLERPAHAEPMRADYAQLREWLLQQRDPSRETTIG